MTEKNYALITGASSGIGRAIAFAFAKQGLNLILVARSEDKLEAVKKAIQLENPEIAILISICDLSKPEEVDRLYEWSKDYKISRWINCAGLGSHHTIEGQDVDHIRLMLATNIDALMALSTYYVNDYADVEGACLVNVASTVGYGITSGSPSYSASKFFVTSFTEALYWEMKDRPITIKQLVPAATATGFMQAARPFEINPKPKENFNGNTSQEVAEALMQLLESDYFMVFADYNRDYQFVYTNPKFSHTLTKSSNPNLIYKED